MIYHLRYSSFFPLLIFPRIVIINNLLKYNALHLVYATFWYIRKHRCTHWFHLYYSFHKKQITPIFIVDFTPLVFLPSIGRHYPFLTILPNRLSSFPAVYREWKKRGKRKDLLSCFFSFPGPEIKWPKTRLFLIILWIICI